MITTRQFNRYKNIINKIDESFNKDVLTWRRASAQTIPAYFEDNLNDTVTDIDLKVLIGYNYFRTWPMTKDTLEGAQDEQNMVVHINRDYLTNLGYTTPKGYFNFSPEDDVFIHRGIKYRSFGDTLHSQAGDEPLFIQLVLKRDVIGTGDDRYNQ